MVMKPRTHSNKHHEFVNQLRYSTAIPEPQSASTYVAIDFDSEDETDYDLMHELEKKFDELFGPLD